MQWSLRLKETENTINAYKKAYPIEVVFEVVSNTFVPILSKRPSCLIFNSFTNRIAISRKQNILFGRADTQVVATSCYAN